MSLSFQELGIAPELLETLESLEYAEPTPIQTEAIPPLLQGRDVLGQAQTGTGKTAAFTLPILQNMDKRGLQTLILTPTRELANQVAEAVHRYGRGRGVRVLPIYGGQSYSRQIRRLEKGVNVVVGTPGRTLDLIKQGELDLSNVRFLVLDEADEMLKMGFIDDVEAILSATDVNNRQTALFSATFSPEIRRLAKQYMRDALHITIPSDELTVENIEQRYYIVDHRDKVAALSRLLEVENLQNTLIFTRTKVGAAELAETLLARGYPASAIHGDLPQSERERILHRFRKGYLSILVATDVVARGVDIPEVSHVINFDIPQLGIEYVHRVGRTGRAGRSGSAITLITPKERYRLRQIEDYTRKRITKGKLPTREKVLRQREEQFKHKLAEAMEQQDLSAESPLLDEIIQAGYSMEEVSLSLLQILRSQEEQRPLEEIRSINEHRERRQEQSSRSKRGKRDRRGRERGMVRLMMNLGRNNGMNPGEIVYTIASRSNIPGKVIGAIEIQQNKTFLDIPEAHVDTVLQSMKHGKIRGQHLTLTRA